MQIQYGENLVRDGVLFATVRQCRPIIDEFFGEFRTAVGLLELARDYRDRRIVRFIIKDHGRTVQTGFAPDEFENDHHFRNRCYQFVEQVASLQPNNDCPNCGTRYGDEPLPFRCRTCEFQIVQACPGCDREVPIAEYGVISSTLWRCPRCHTRVHARYAEPMFNSRGFFVQPLVQLTNAETAGVSDG